MRSLGVAVAHPDPGVVDELIHALEADADLYLALDHSKAAVVLAGEPALAGMASGAVEGRAVVGLAADHDVATIARAALRCGAQEIVCWPEDKARLRGILRDASSRARLAAGRAEGRIVAVTGARGGAGTTTVAAMIARELPEAVVVDLDVTGGGQAAFLSEGAEPTLGDVLNAVEDLDPQSLPSAMAAHASGRAICAHARATGPTAPQAARLVALLRASVPVAVFDLGRVGEDAARGVLAAADRTVCVCAPDVASMRGARDLADLAPRSPLVVLNQAARLRLSSRDVARVLGERPAAVVAADPAVRRAGEAGRLPARGPARRALDRFASRLLAEASDGS